MPWRGNHITELDVRKDIEGIMRTFTDAASEEIVVERRREEYDPDTGEHAGKYDQVYKGQAITRLNSGLVQGYGLGTVENASLVMLVNGKHDIQQGDLVNRGDGRTWEVTVLPGWFGVFMVLNLTQYDQIQKPTVP